MRRARWAPVFLMVLVLALGTACLTLFPRSSEPLSTDDWFESERGPLKFDPVSLPSARTGVMYEAEIKVTQNVTPVGDFSVDSNLLPPGLELVILEDVDDTARITGTPEEAGTYTFTISVWCYGTNVNGQTGGKEYTIVVE